MGSEGSLERPSPYPFTAVTVNTYLGWSAPFAKPLTMMGLVVPSAVTFPAALCPVTR